MLYRVRDTKKRSCLRGEKRLARILMHLLIVQIEGTAEAALRKSTLISFSSGLKLMSIQTSVCHEFTFSLFMNST
jgi:hypothetical protein